MQDEEQQGPFEGEVVISGGGFPTIGLARASSICVRSSRMAARAIGRTPRAGAAVALAAAALLVAPAAVQADSIVYVKRGDVWLAKPDGTGARALTRNGTPRKPYRSPSQSDAGTIVALEGKRTLHVLNRRGKRLQRPRSITGAPMPPYDPRALDVRISPGGKHVAFTIWLVVRNQDPDPNKPAGEDLGTQVWVTKLRNAKAINIERTPQSPSWIDNRRFLVFTPFLYHTEDVWTAVVGGRGGPWFQDLEVVDPLDPTDGAPLNSGELTRAQDKLALIRGPNSTAVGDPTSIRVYAVSGIPARPVARCDLRPASRIRYEPPTWSPNGRALAWSEADGIWSTPIADGAGDCAAQPRRLIRGAGQPDWGPAGVPRRR